MPRTWTTCRSSGSTRTERPGELRSGRVEARPRRPAIPAAGGVALRPVARPPALPRQRRPDHRASPATQPLQRRVRLERSPHLMLTRISGAGSWVVGRRDRASRSSPPEQGRSTAGCSSMSTASMSRLPTTTRPGTGPMSTDRCRSLTAEFNGGEAVWATRRYSSSFHPTSPQPYPDSPLQPGSSASPLGLQGRPGVRRRRVLARQADIQGPGLVSGGHRNPTATSALPSQVSHW